MGKFKQNKIEHKMPHSLPKADFFETFPKELFARIDAEDIRPIPPEVQNMERKPESQLNSFIRLSIAGGIAATLAIVLIIKDKYDASNDVFAVKYTLVSNIDSYLSGMSDEEFSHLHTTSMKQSDFYLNLPNF